MGFACTIYMARMLQVFMVYCFLKLWLNVFGNVIGTGDEVGTLWDQYAVDEFYKDDMSWLEDDALIGSDKLQYYGVMCLLLLSFDMSSRVTTKIICLFVLLEVFLQKANWIWSCFTIQIPIISDNERRSDD